MKQHEYRSESGEFFGDLHALKHAEGMGERAFLPQGVRRPFYLSPALSPSKQKIGSHEQREDHGDDTVHGEKCGVKFAEIVALDQGMFVQE